MKKTDDRALALLVSISDEIAKLRNDVRVIQTGLIRVGAIIPKKAESVKAMATWNPPILKRLGDIVTIIAQSNPVSAKAFLQEGFDTEVDPAADEMVDPPANQDQADGRDAADGTDPTPRDADRNPWDLWPPWPFNDDDPNKKDLAVNARNAADVTDPIPPNTRDDPDGVNRVKPDTTADSLS